MKLCRTFIFNSFFAIDELSIHFLRFGLCQFDKNNRICIQHHAGKNIPNLLCAVQTLLYILHTYVENVYAKNSRPLFFHLSFILLHVPCNEKCFIENAILPYLLMCLTCIFRSIVYLNGIYVCTLSMENSSAQPHPTRTRISERAHALVSVCILFSILFFTINFLLFPLLLLTCMLYADYAAFTGCFTIVPSVSGKMYALIRGATSRMVVK